MIGVRNEFDNSWMNEINDPAMLINSNDDVNEKPWVDARYQTNDGTARLIESNDAFSFESTYFTAKYRNGSTPLLP